MIESDGEAGTGPPPVNWVAHRGDVSAANSKMDDDKDPSPRRSDPNLLTAVQITGNVAKLSLDMTGQDEFLGHGPFKPTIRLIAQPSNGPDVSPYQQYCHWDDAAQGATETPPTSGLPQQRADSNPGTGGWGSPSQPGQVPVQSTPAEGPPASPEPSTGRPGIDFFVFQSPSGNIACRVGPNEPPGYALCDVGEHDFSPTCPPGSEIRLALQQGDGPRFEGCTTDSLFAAPHVGLLYGGSWRSGSITCYSEEAGITCTDAGTGHFFTLARQSYQMG